MLPDREGMFRWLREEAVTADGSVLSWTNPAHPGYAYPEAAGILLHLLSQTGRASELERRIAHALYASVSEAGGVGRAGVDYVFDTAVALRGLMAFERAGGTIENEQVLERMFGFIRRLAEQQRAVSSGPVGARWSNGYNPHLLKVVLVVDEWDERTSDARCASLRTRLVETLLPMTLQWLNQASTGAPRYVHALCYATEALHHLGKRGMREARDGARNAAALLAALGRDGPLPAWRGRGPEDRLATDATAQAVRMWVATDRTAFASNIDGALRHLASVQHASGGLFYAPKGNDVNTWCTVFAAQAVRWVERGPDDALI